MGRHIVIFGIILSFVFFGAVPVTYSQRATAREIRAEIQRHREAIRRLKEELHNVIGRGHQGSGYSEAEEYGEEAYGEAEEVEYEEGYGEEGYAEGEVSSGEEASSVGAPTGPPHHRRPHLGPPPKVRRHIRERIKEHLREEHPRARPKGPHRKRPLPPGHIKHSRHPRRPHIDKPHHPKYRPKRHLKGHKVPGKHPGLGPHKRKRGPRKAIRGRGPGARPAPARGLREKRHLAPGRGIKNIPGRGPGARPAPGRAGRRGGPRR